MRAKQSTAMAGLIITVIFFSDCNKQKTQLVDDEPGLGQGRAFRIHIYADPTSSGNCLVDWPKGTLWETRKHTVVWESDDNQYTVDFSVGKNGSPFAGNSKTFPVSPKGKNASGDLVGNPNYYDYGINDANDKPCLKPGDDPGVIVKR